MDGYTDVQLDGWTDGKTSKDRQTCSLDALLVEILSKL